MGKNMTQSIKNYKILGVPGWSPICAFYLPVRWLELIIDIEVFFFIRIKFTIRFLVFF